MINRRAYAIKRYMTNFFQPSNGRIGAWVGGFLLSVSVLSGFSSPAYGNQAGISEHLSRGRTALMADPRAALAEAEGARKLAPASPSSQSDILQVAELDWLTGAALIGLDRAPEATKVIEQGLSLGVDQIAPHSKLLGDLTYAHGMALAFQGQFVRSLAEFRKAYEIYGLAGERRGQALAIQNIGTVYVQARDYSRAVRYFEQSTEIDRADPSMLLSALNNAAAALNEQGKYDDAIRRYSKALALARQMRSPILQVRVLEGLARAQLRAGRFDAADQSIGEGIALSTSMPSAAWRSGLYTVAAEAALRKNKLDEAARLINLVFKDNTAHSAPLLRDANRVAYSIFKARGDTRLALEHFEAFERLDNQARETAASANAALTAAQFDFANQRASIAQLRANEVQNEAKIARSQRTILVTLLAGTALVAVIAGIGFLSIRRSRNQVRAANDELSEANSDLEQALTARTQFLATTSHEIRTPLNGILGMTQVLLADRGLAADVKGKIELVHGAGETMRALVDDILDVAKMTTGELKLHPAEMDLHRLLKDTVQVWSGQAESKGISIVVNLANCPQRIVQDEVRLRQIIFNLTANAVKFTDRGEVRVVASAVPHGDGEQLRVQISDTGIGIPPDKLEEIFESFRQVDSGTTRRHGGTGLGLAICRNLAQVMGGDITVASVLGAGATFTLDVPLERAADLRVASVDDGPITLDKARLLLVEANPLSQSILRAVLSPKVSSFATASAAEEAVVTLAEGQTDLVVMDATTMRMDFAAIESIARTITQTGGRTVLMWPKPDDSVAEKIAGIGVSKLLATPLAAQDLVAALIALYATQDSQEVVAA